MSRRGRISPLVVAVGVVAGLLSVPLVETPAAAAVIPAGFQEQVVFSGLNQPTNVEFAPDGRIFVAEKSGVIKVFDNLADPTPTVFANLSNNVHELHDRGLFGLAFPPNFPTNPWVYVLYTYDAPASGVHYPNNDACADANSGTCVVTGRLSRLQASGNVMTGTEQVLIFDWCQQFASHSIGDLHFGQDGALYVTAGDGASYNATDFGQFNNNPCGDPANEGGALRSQDSRSTADPTGLDGTLLRLNPDTGAAMAGNPNAGSPDLNIRRIVAQGMRNPYRFTIRPGTNEVWIGDVGWNTWEEIDRITNPTGGVTNFGWPCYEGAGRQSGYDSANLPLCESLYTAGPVTGPYYTYNHSAKVVPNESCPTGSSSISGTVFYPASGGSYPAAYNGALFFADYSRQCIWAMKPASPGGLPSTSNIETFISGSSFPVDLAMGPGGELYYADIVTGSIVRVRYFPNNQPPVPVINAAPTSGAAPLTVTFNGAGSTDADPADQGRLTYAWDFTNNGSTDATTQTATFSYPAGSYTAKLTVTDTLGASASTTVAINSGNDAPTAFIDTPAAGFTWRVGNVITFSGHATDPQQGTLPASALSWQLNMQHCATPTTCHTHFMQSWSGVAGGSFTAPDHEYPAYMELVLTATDAQNQTSTVIRRLDPQTVNLTFTSNPTGLQEVVGSTAGTTPFTRTVIIGSANTVSATTPQSVGGNTYTFGSWSDGGAQTHTIIAPATPTTYTAAYTGTVDVNVALNRPATADSQCAATEGAAKAFNGSVSGGWSDKWCSLGATKWLQVDLGSAYNINRFVLRHANAGGEPTEFNTRDFNIQTSNDGTNWTTAVTVVGNTANVTTHLATATGRYVRLNVTKPTQTTDNAARIYEFEVYGQAGPPPPPAVVAGTVTSSAGGAPIAGATVSVSGTALSTTTAADGTYSFPNVPTGSRTITASMTGFVTGSTTVTATSGTTATANIVLNPVPPPPPPAVVAGTVTGAPGGTPLAGATVTVSGTSLTTTTAADGTYSFPNVPTGTRTITAQKTGYVSGSVIVTATSGATVTGNITLNPLPPCSDSFGYTCTSGPRTFVPANQTVVALSGDDDYAPITLPFPITFYGTTYTTAWLDTNGLLTFATANGSAWNHGSIPSAAASGKANLAVYPFWDDLWVDASASVRTAVVGTAPNRQFIVEWRNVRFYSNSSARISFEIIFDENGTITFAYSGIDALALEQGGSATVGIENGTGTIAIQFSLNSPVLRSGEGVTFTPPLS